MIPQTKKEVTGVSRVSFNGTGDKKMPRNGSGVFSLPAGLPSNGDTSDATDDIRTPLFDLEADMNTPRPVVAGGTGASSASAALVNLGLTATAAELNILDGATLSVAELNVLDGIPGTLTATELGYVDGVTSAIQTQLNAKQATITTLALANGGTGAALVDPNADRLLFWDDSAGAMAFLTAGDGLTISGTTISGRASGTVNTTTGGTAVEFAIPTTATRITFSLVGASLSGTDNFLVQLSTGAAYVTSGYGNGSGGPAYSTRSGSGVTSTAGLPIFGGATGIFATGTVELIKHTGNTWVATHLLQTSTGGDDMARGSGIIALAGAIDGIRLTRTGTETFDAMSANVHYS